MKKQLLIAAVAATMGTAAIADISIAGAAKVNFTNVDFDDTQVDTNDFKREMDLKITGKSGDTTVVMNFANDTLGNGASAGISAEDTYVATSIEGVSVKVGAWDNGNNELRSSTRGDNKLSASTTMGGVKITYDATDESAGKLADTVKLSGEVSGVAVSYKSVDNGEDISVSTTVGGVAVSYFAMNRDAANTDKSVVTASGTFGGVGVKVAQATADSSATISGDTWMGDYEGSTGAYSLSAGQDVTAVELSGSIAGNSVKFRNVSIDDKAAEDTSFNKFIVTRPLANGTTFEATYTDLDDDDSTTTDSSTLDLELAVKF